jgi:hypothetical protein
VVTSKTLPNTASLIPNLHKHPHRMPVIDVLALTKLGYIWVERYERIGRTEVQSVVNTPINLREREKKDKSLSRDHEQKKKKNWNRGKKKKRTYLADLTRGVEQAL